MNSGICMPNGARAGDALVLTKPLGIRVAVNLNQWIDTNPKRLEPLSITQDMGIDFHHTFYQINNQTMCVYTPRGSGRGE